MTVRGWIVGLVFLAIGCQDEGVRVLRVPKPPARQTIAIIVPRTDAAWFLKLNGPADAVAADETAFREFSSSVLFQDGDPPMKYTVPQGWKLDESEAAKGGMFRRFATYRTSNDSEVIITKLGAEANAVLPNVNRWRGEVGLEPIAESELDKLVTTIDVGGTKSTLVHVNGRSKIDKKPEGR